MAITTSSSHVVMRTETIECTNGNPVEYKVILIGPFCQVTLDGVQASRAATLLAHKVVITIESTSE